MSEEYSEREARLVSRILESEKALLQLRIELFSMKKWIVPSLEMLSLEAAMVYKPPTISDLPPEDLAEIILHCDLMTRYKVRRVGREWKTIMLQRKMRENVFMDWDSFYNSGCTSIVKMSDWTEDQSDRSPTLAAVKAISLDIKHLTYNALKHGIDYRHQHIYKEDQCQLLRRFLNNCPNLETLTMRCLPGMTWTHLTLGLTEVCPNLEWIFAFKCDQTVDILKTDYTYSPARRRMPVPRMAVEMRGDVAKNFDLASDALLWPFPEEEVKAHIAWIAEYTPQLTGKAEAWAKDFLRKRTGSRESADKIDLKKVDYSLLARNYWLLDLTSLMMDNAIPCMVPPDAKWIYR